MSEEKEDRMDEERIIDEVNDVVEPTEPAAEDSVVKETSAAEDGVVVEETTAPPLPSQTDSHSATIAQRWDEAVDAAKPVNRSGDIVPLIREFDKLKKQLKIVIAAAKLYHASMLTMDMARMQVATEFASMAESSPVQDVLNGEESSFVGTHQMIFALGKTNAKMYHQEIIDYLVDWDKTVTDRVEADVEETQKLHKILVHYEVKVEGLRKKAAAIEKKSKTLPVKFAAKLERNIEKMNEAWKNHELVASTLCNLLEEVTHRGWKDLYPVVKASINYHQECAKEECDVFATLSSVEERLSSIFNEKKRFDPVKEPSQVFIALAQAEKPKTTGQSSDNGNKALTGVAKFPDLLPADTSRTEGSQDQIAEKVSDEVEEEEEVVEIDSKADSVNLDDEKGSDEASVESVEEEVQVKPLVEAPPSPTGVIHGIPAV